MRKLVLTFTTAILAVTSAPVFAEVDTAAYDRLFRTSMQDKKIPGAAYAIVEMGEPLKVGTFGTRAKGRKLPVTEDTVFRLASVSKTFSASLVAKLVEEGQLSLDTKVAPFVPVFQLKKKGHAEQIEVSHLLSHTVGLTPNSYDNMIEDGWDLPKILPRFKRLAPICAPGKCYGYQNIAFSLVEPIVEATVEDEFNSLMQERILTPLGMQTASIGMKGYLEKDDRAHPHVNTRRGWYRTKVKPHYYNVSPAAGVNASIKDMVKWVESYLGWYPEVISPGVIDMVTEKRVRTKRELYKRQWRPYLEDAHYGLGWRIYDFGEHEIVMHAGGVSGFRSIVSFSEEYGVGLVILMNAESRVIDDLTAQFWDTQFKERGGATTVAAAR
ncbi:MAG: beta-lactamase family protein [Kordiimonadaceae bacterium]|nr:beta-lactamase family protein [Kordiimonadaceae bacterium]MBO6569102.1 beta-lactamase family protein [Kordiimonadaceae bacterium]MBO6964577.1 beta-lactamase family protein [Kordiimonadaceae bacterium]